MSAGKDSTRAAREQASAVGGESQIHQHAAGGLLRRVQGLATSRLGPAGGPLAHIIIGSASDDLPSDGAAEGPTYLALRSRGVSSIAHRTRPLPRPKSVRRAPLAHHRQHDFRARASPLHPRMPLAPSHRH